MIRYLSADITFQEVPGEVSLVFFITGCPRRCPGCHSPELQQDIGLPLTVQVIREYCERYPDMFNCICFMGDGGDFENLARLALEAKLHKKAVALYTGAERTDIPFYLLSLLTFIKVGPYIEERGGLASAGTNQQFFYLKQWCDWQNNTYKFQFEPRELNDPVEELPDRNALYALADQELRESGELDDECPDDIPEEDQMT